MPPHPTPHHAVFPPPARAVAAAGTLPTMPYCQQPAANRPPPPLRPRPGVRNILLMPVQRRQQQLAQAPIVPSQAPTARAGVAPPPYHGQTHRAPHGHFAHATHMQPRSRMQPTYAPPPGPPPNWQGRAQTRYAPPPGPPPGWMANPPPPPRAPSVEVPQHQAQLPLSREQTASPWSAAGFTPSPVVSTAATTPRLALTPSPGVGGPVPLPIQARVARSATPHTPASVQRAVRASEQGAAPAQVGKATLKRRIDEADAGACEPGPSKRPVFSFIASVQARSSETDTTGRQVQQYNNLLPSQRAPASPQRDAAPTPKGPEPATSSAKSKKEDAPVVADDDARSLFGDDDCIDDDDATLAMELALALGQDDVPEVASEDAGPLCEDGDGIDDAELARELALALGQDDTPAIETNDLEPVFEDGDSIGDDAELARELALALGEDDAACAAANDDGSERPAHTAQLSLPLSPAGAGAGAAGTAAKATSAVLLGSEPSASASTQEIAAATFALCLPGTDPVPEGSVARSGPPAHLMPVALAQMATAPSGGSRGKGKKAVRTSPPHRTASNGATSSAPPGEAAEPPTAPGNRGKGGTGKKASSAKLPSTAAGPSATAAAITHAAAVEKSVKRSKAMAAQNPDVFKSYSWMEGSSSASGSGIASTSFAAAAPVPARPLFTRSPPPPGPVPKGGRRNAVKGRRCPTSEPMPKDRPFWCKMCWEDRVKTTYWYNYDCLRQHVREKHPDLLDSDLWKHPGM